MAKPTTTTTDSPELITTLALLNQGLRPIPLRVPGSLKAKGKDGAPDELCTGKEPLGLNWGTIRHSEQSIREIHRVNHPINGGPGVGVGLLLGANPDPQDPTIELGIIDIEVDDPTEAEAVKSRMFGGDHRTRTLTYGSNRGGHELYRYDPRLAKYGLSIIKGKVVEPTDEAGEVTSKIEGNRHYIGIEIRIGTLDPKRPAQLQSVIPPTRKVNGEPRVWMKGDEVVGNDEVIGDLLAHILPLPECVFEDLDRYALAAREEDSRAKARLRKGIATTPSGVPVSTSGVQWDKEQVKAAILPHSRALAERWGVVFTGKRFPSTGFLECYGIVRKDRKASAGFNEATGVFNDFNGPTLTIFDLGLNLRQYPDFATMVNELGREFGVLPVPPKGSKHRQVAVDTFASVAQRAGMFSLEKIQPKIVELLATDDPSKIYGNQKATFGLARMAECNPGGFTIIRNLFAEKAKADDRYSVKQLDVVIKALRSEAKKANDAAMKVRRQKDNQARRGAQAPVSVADDPHPPQSASDGLGGVEFPPANEVLDKLQEEHDRALAVSREGESRTIKNWELVESEDEQGELTLRPAATGVLSIDERVERLCPGWPKSVGDKLFIQNRRHEPDYLNSPARLFAYFDGLGRVDWQKGPQHITQERYYEHQRMSSERFDAIEIMPHTPPIRGIFYMFPEMPKSSGKLDELVDKFLPATDEDRSLIKAWFMTPSWGGLPGKRPAWLITGPDNDPEMGRGVGKTTLVDVGSETLYLGSIDITANDDIPGVKTRLLSPDGELKRIIRIDNVKTHRFSWGDLEGLITSSVISGRKLYDGEGSRPNTLSVVITLNGASMSKDMAKRVMMIKLARPANPDDKWEEEVRDFATEHRWEILAEIAEILAKPTPKGFEPKTRWASWEAGVLSKVENAEACQKILIDRQGSIDDDEDNRGEVADYFRKRLTELGHDPVRGSYGISSRLAAAWLKAATGEILATNRASSYIKGLAITELFQTRKEYFRGWIWRGPFSTAKDREFILIPDSAASPAPTKVIILRDPDEDGGYESDSQDFSIPSNSRSGRAAY